MPVWLRPEEFLQVVTSALRNVRAEKSPYRSGYQLAKAYRSTCRCQSLYYHPSNVTDCNHCFCKACISRFQDCPLCGIDITAVQEYPEMAGERLN